MCTFVFFFSCVCLYLVFVCASSLDYYLSSFFSLTFLFPIYTFLLLSDTISKVQGDRERKKNQERNGRSFTVILSLSSFSPLSPLFFLLCFCILTSFVFLHLFSFLAHFFVFTSFFFLHPYPHPCPLASAFPSFLPSLSPLFSPLLMYSHLFRLPSPLFSVAHFFVFASFFFLHPYPHPSPLA